MSRKNVNVALVLAFLFKCVEVFGEYFKDVEEESIRDNFVIIYELLDEMMDFGYPQTTDSRILQECVMLSVVIFCVFVIVQVYHPGGIQVGRHCAEASDGSDKRRLLAIRGDQVPEE